MKQWWVVIYPVKERETIFDVIKREGFDIRVYCPMVRVSQTHKGLVRVVEKPLLFNYMFWYYDFLELPYGALRLRMSFRLLRFNDKPRSITSKEIRRIKQIVKSQDRRFVRMYDDVQFLRKFIGQKVIVRDGAFTGLVGNVNDVRQKGQVVIELLIFNRFVNCEMSVEYVEFVGS